VNKKIFISIGVPGSGKSTALAEICRNRTYRYVSADEVRLLVNGSVESQANPSKVWGIVFELFTKALEDPTCDTIVVDNTNITFDNRKKFYDVAKLYAKQVEFVLVWVDVPVEVAIRRNAGRSRKVPEHVIRGMAERLQPPTVDERNAFEVIVVR